MKLTPILIASPHPDRQLPHRIAQFPDFLAFNMSPRAIGDLVIGPDGLRFVTRLAGGDTIERVVLPLGSWHSVRVRETQHQFSLAFPEALVGQSPTTNQLAGPHQGPEEFLGPAAGWRPDTTRIRDIPSKTSPLWWPDGLALMTAEGGANDHVVPAGTATATTPTGQPAPAWEGLISATQADQMRADQGRTAQGIGGGRWERALGTAQRRWGGAGLVVANSCGETNEAEAHIRSDPRAHADDEPQPT